MAVGRPSDPPSYTYISPALLRTMRSEMRRFLLHSYTRISRITLPDAGTGPGANNAGVDEWNQPTVSFAPPVSGLPCFYEINRGPLVTPRGLLGMNVPRLFVSIDDTLKEGDHVTNVTTSDGSILLIGPVIVESIQRQDPNVGGPVIIEATLREAQIIQSS
jgi:hypothetical protein